MEFIMFNWKVNAKKNKCAKWLRKETYSDISFGLLQDGRNSILFNLKSAS